MVICDSFLHPQRVTAPARKGSGWVESQSAIHRRPDPGRASLLKQRQRARQAQACGSKLAVTLPARHCAALRVPALGQGSHRAESLQPRAANPSSDAPQTDDAKQNAIVLFWTLAVIVTGVLNRIFYKMALKPLGNYVFFLAQFQTFAYTAVYFTILYTKLRAGSVTKDQIKSLDKRLFVAIGGFEASALVCGFLGASLLPGVVLPLLQQSYLLWQILVNKLLLGRSLLRIELVGAAMVGFGVCYAAWPSRSGGSAFSSASPIGIALFTVSLFLLVFDTLAKEKLFEDAEKQHKRPLDVFAVNSYGSAAQAAFVLLLLPVLAGLRGISPGQLPDYLLQGWKAMRGITPSCGTDVSAAPYLTLLYVAMNLAYNVSVLSLLRNAGNVVMSLASSVLIPITIWAFTWPWPYLDPSPPLGLTFFLGAGIMLSGIATFNWPMLRPLLGGGESPKAKPSPA